MFHIYLASPEGTEYLTETAQTLEQAEARIKVLEKSEEYPESEGWVYFWRQATTWEDLQW